MRPLVLSHGQTAPPNSLGVDGDPAGCAALYSHWPGHPPPTEIAADTSTAILLRATRDPERWLSGFDYCVNDHIDTDGVLAMALACHPELAVSHGPIMVGAASYGDFCHWPGADAARLALCIHQLVREYGDAKRQQLVEHVVDDLADILDESRASDPERDAQIAQIMDARSRLDAGGDANLRLWAMPDAPLHVMQAAYRWGHHADGPNSVYAADDCPPWALHGFIPADHFQLLCLHDDTGTRYQLDAPRHSWAITNHLPSVSWPDCSSLAADLNAIDDDRGRWVANDSAREQGFTCVLTRLTDDGGDKSQLAPSQIPVERAAQAVASLLQR